MKRSTAFTLIELLVVISIIALLSSVVVASLNSAREKGRLAAGRQFAAGAYHAAADQAVGIWDLDEGSGTRAGDRSGNGNDGTLTNGPAWSSDTYSGRGTSVLFSGSNYIEVPYSTDLAPTSAVTFGAWFKTNNLASAQRVISKTETGGYQMSLNENGVCPTNTLCVAIYIGSSYYTVSIPLSGLSTGRWYYALGSYDGETEKLYLDGKEVASNASPSGPIGYAAANSLCIGNEPSATTCNQGGYFNGYIDEAVVYAKALTASEAGELYADGLPAHPLARE